MVVYTKVPNFVADLCPLSLFKSQLATKTAEETVQFLHDVNQRLLMLPIKDKLIKKRRYKEFTVGDLVMAHISKGHIPTGSYSKLQDIKLRSFRIMKKVGDNAYTLDLPESLQVSPTFNIADFFEYHTPDDGIVLKEIVQMKQCRSKSFPRVAMVQEHNQ